MRTSLARKALIQYQNSHTTSDFEGSTGINFGDVQRRCKKEIARRRAARDLHVGSGISWHRSYPSRSLRWMLEDILYSKRVVTLVWFNSKNTVEGGRSIFLQPWKLRRTYHVAGCVCVCVFAHAYTIVCNCWHLTNS